MKPHYVHIHDNHRECNLHVKALKNKSVDFLHGLDQVQAHLKEPRAVGQEGPYYL